jgi:hypothetical protein
VSAWTVVTLLYGHLGLACVWYHPWSRISAVHDRQSTAVTPVIVSLSDASNPQACNEASARGISLRVVTSRDFRIETGRRNFVFTKQKTVIQDCLADILFVA